MSATTLAALRTGRARLARFGAWTQGEAARDVLGDPTQARGAECWCAAGAMLGTGDGESEALAALGHALTGRTLRDDEAMCVLAEWNDESARTHADVLALYDRAIAAVGAER